MLCWKLAHVLYAKPPLAGGADFPHAALSVVSFVFALNRAYVQALNTTRVLRLIKAYALTVNKAHVRRLNNDSRLLALCRRNRLST